MDKARLEALSRQLGSRLPLVGAGIRRKACRQLAEDGGAEVVPHLVSALRAKDREVRAIARAGLGSLTQQSAIDALCEEWVETRHGQLGAIIADCGYVAAQPVRTRVLSGLQCGVPVGGEVDAEAIAALLGALGDKDEKLRAGAMAALQSLREQSAVDALCEVVILDPSGPAAEVARRAGYEHSAVSRRCLVYLLTGQIERYIDLDFDLQYVRAEYEAGDQVLRASVAYAVRRSGDARLAGILLQSAPSTGPISKRAADLTEREANVVAQVYARHGRWADVFGLLFHMPLCAVVPALDLLKGSGWQPDDPVERSLLGDLLALRRDVGKLPEAPPAPDVVLGAVFGKWIAAGRSGEAGGLSTEKLRNLLCEAVPADAVAALSALQARGLLSPDDIETARTHRSWPVRLAYLALCEVAPELAFSGRPVGGEGGGLWVDQWAPHLLARSVRDSRGIGLTLDQIESLQSVLAVPASIEPERAALGRILCALGGHHLRHTIEIDEGMFVAIDETDIEVEG